MKYIALVCVIMALIFSSTVFFRKSKPVMTATCKDGAISYSKHRSGTCSHHRGVFKWASEGI